MKRITLIFFFTAIASFSYSQAQRQLNFGLIGVSYEIPLGNAITIAPAAYTNFNLNYLTLGAKANYYFDELFGLTDAWDVYGGANLGFGLAISDSKSSGLDFGLQVGGRWFWNETWGVYVEVGGGKLGGGAYGVGITMKM
jgi:hypothetical protein